LDNISRSPAAFSATRIDNLISPETQSDGQTVYENSDKADATGVEVELDGRWAGGSARQGKLQLRRRGAAANPTDSQQLSSAPGQVGRECFLWCSSAYSPAWTPSTPARSKPWPENTISGFSVLNFTLLGHTLGKHLDLSASVYNVFNKTYFNPGQPEDPEDSIQQDGRTFRIKTHRQVLKLRMQFSGKDESKPSQPRLRATLRIGPLPSGAPTCGASASGPWAATECVGRPGQSGIPLQFRKAGGVAAPGLA